MTDKLGNLAEYNEETGELEHIDPNKKKDIS